MNVTTSGKYSNYVYGTTKASGAKKGKQSNSSTSSSRTDSVSVSQAYRSASAKPQEVKEPQTERVSLKMHTKETRLGYGALQFTNRAWNGQQTAEEAASGWKYYTKEGRVTSEIDASLADERSSLGRRIDSALKKAGIQLGEKDALKFTVGKDGKIVVDTQGLTAQSKGKAADIERAINSDAGLAKQLYMNSASSVLQKADKAPGPKATYELGNNDPMVAAAQKEAVDDWMRSTLGFGIEELEEEGYGPEMTEYGEYGKKLDDFGVNEMSLTDFGQLEATIRGIIGNSQKDNATEFEASFTYQNGTLTDNRVPSSAPQAQANSTNSAEVAAKLNFALKGLNSGYQVTADGDIVVPEGASADLVKLLEQAKADGSLGKITEKDRKLIAEHAKKNGGKADDYVVVHKADGTASVAARSEAAPADATTAEPGKGKGSGLDAVMEDFKAEFKKMIGSLGNNAFGLKLENGKFNLSNRRQLTPHFANNIQQVLNGLNGFGAAPAGNIGNIAKTLAGLASKQKLKIDFS